MDPAKARPLHVQAMEIAITLLHTDPTNFDVALLLCKTVVAAALTDVQ